MRRYTAEPKKSKRSKSPIKIVTMIGLFLVLGFGVLMFATWIYMLVLGALASTSGWPTAWGFWHVFWLTVLQGALLGSRVRPQSK